jgi:hypothetical protein
MITKIIIDILLRRVKTTDEYSGYGYELTIRVKKALNEKQPPMWPIKLLQALARYTFNNGIKIFFFTILKFYQLKQL